MSYIAIKPVRFDKDYAIGEIIPDDVIDPAMINRLSEMGRIVKTDITAAPKETAKKTTAKETVKEAAKKAEPVKTAEPARKEEQIEADEAESKAKKD